MACGIVGCEVSTVNKLFTVITLVEFLPENLIVILPRNVSEKQHH